MKTTSHLWGVAIFLLLLPLSTSISFATQTREIIYHTSDNVSDADNGTVTLTIRRGWNEQGLFSRIGYTLIIDNTLGTKELNYSYCITYNYLLKKDAVDYRTPSTLQPGTGTYTNILPIPFPTIPFRVTIYIQTNTTNELRHSRTGIMLFNCFLLFNDGKTDSMAGES
jgi:hypothetical protein